MPSPKPYHKCKSYGSWGGTVIHSRNEFINFYSKTSTGAVQTVLCLNPYGSDYVPLHQFIDTRLNNVMPDALAYIMPPNPGWANL